MNWLDIVIGIPLIFAVIKGYKSGLIMQIAILIGVIVSVVFAGKLSEFVAPYFPETIGIPPHLIPPISYIIAFCIITSAFILGGKTIETLFKIVQLNFVNRLFGALFSVMTWLVSASIVLVLIVNMDQKKILIKDSTRNSSYLFEPLIHTGETLVPFLKTKSTNFLSIEN